MRICVAGKNRVAVDGAKRIVSLFGANRLCVTVNSTDDGCDTWQPSLKKWATDNHVPVVALDDLYDVDDLFFFSLEFDRIIDPAKFKSPHLFNIHFSLLPEYKGAHTAIWPILDGKDYSGVTLHRIDPGIDTGEIIYQERFHVAFKDTSKDLYEKYLTVGATIFSEWCRRLVEGNYTSQKQSAINSTFRSRKSIDFAHVTIDFKQTAFQVHNQIRAFTFRDYQLPVINGIPVSQSHILEERSSAKPGTLLCETEMSFRFATVDYDILIKKDAFEQALAVLKGSVGPEKLIPALSHVVNVQERNARGWTLLIVAAYHYNIDAVKWLLNHGSEINEANYKGTTVLMYAKSSPSRNNDLSFLEWLIDQGADVNKRDVSGLTVLTYAKRDNDRQLIDFLAAKGGIE
jgi:methionyl-tRNA formyltransferase